MFGTQSGMIHHDERLSQDQTSSVTKPMLVIVPYDSLGTRVLTKVSYSSFFSRNPTQLSTTFL